MRRVASATRVTFYTVTEAAANQQAMRRILTETAEAAGMNGA